MMSFSSGGNESKSRFHSWYTKAHCTVISSRTEPTKASALSRSVSWYCCSGPRVFPHGPPFSATRSRAEPCSLLSGAPAHGGRTSFTVRAKWDKAGDSCLLMNQLRKAITSRVAAKVGAESKTRPPHALWTLTWSTTARKTRRGKRKKCSAAMRLTTNTQQGYRKA